MRTEKQQKLLDEYNKSLEYVKTLTKQERDIFVAGMHMANVFSDLHHSMTLEQNYALSVSLGLKDDPRIKELGEYLKKKEELAKTKLRKLSWLRKLWF
jgi:hypothetical protein